MEEITHRGIAQTIELRAKMLLLFLMFTLYQILFLKHLCKIKLKTEEITHLKFFLQKIFYILKQIGLCCKHDFKTTTSLN